MDISLTGGTIGLLVLGLVVLIVGLIFALRSVLNKYSAAEVEVLKSQDRSLATRKKNPTADAFKWSGVLTKFGLAAAVLTTLLAFSWTQYEKDVYIPEGAEAFVEEIEIEPPRTAEPPPPPPPPPPPVIEEVPEEEIIEEEQPEFEDQSIDEETVIEEEPVEVEEAPPPPPPPPPPPEPEVEEIFTIVEQKPRFPGCEDVSGGNKEKSECANKKLLEFLYKNIKYPPIAKENGIEGTTYVQFVVEKNGSVTDIKTVRALGGGCSEEAERVVKMMNSMPQKWTPGKQRGRAVRVQYVLPVKFKLE